MRGKMLYAAMLVVCGAKALAADVGLSVNVGQPGFFGQIDIGGAPAPRLIYTQPVVVAPEARYGDAPPIYLHVPPGYERHWRRHCAEYDACGRRVYFVRDDWYNREYVPHYQHYGDRDHRDDRDHHEDRDDNGDRH